MILDRILDYYREDDSVPRGNPTGSRLGDCAAKLQLLTHPARSHPTPYPPRSRMVFEEGHRTEEWLMGLLAKTMPGNWGLRQQPFYFRVPLLSEADMEAAQVKLSADYGEPGRIWGTVQAGFLPPEIRRVDPVEQFPTLAGSGRLEAALGAQPPGTAEAMRERWRVRGIGARSQGLVLDPAARVVWVPVFIDAVAMYEGEPAIVEVKSRSNAGFRRFLMGSPSYGDRLQMAGALSATGFSTVVWLVHRKETSHLAEVVMTRARTLERVAITVQLMGGKVERYYSQPVQALVPVSGQEADTALFTEAGTPAQLPADALWDTAQVEVPHSLRLVEEARERVRRVLTWPVDSEPHREYGPTFPCPTCDTTGTQTRRKDGSGPLKTPKPCGDCHGTGTRSRVQLPTFPCGYCPVVGACWPQVELEVTDRPRYFVERLHTAAIPYYTPPSY